MPLNAKNIPLVLLFCNRFLTKFDFLIQICILMIETDPELWYNFITSCYVYFAVRCPMKITSGMEPKYVKLIQQLKNLVADLYAHGENCFPSERELCER